MKNSKYEVLEKIGEGSFGQIYKGQNITNKKTVAIKFEKQEAKNIQNISHQNFELLKSGEISHESNLLNEIRTLLQLQSFSKFPKLHAYGYEKGLIYMVSSHFGDNLDQKLQRCGNRFSRNTICKIDIQALDLLSCMHSKGFIHRDIKPENFVCGLKQQEQIYLIDFGLASRYLNEDNEHMCFSLNNGFIGTARYASIYAHKGYGQSRRDDLISLGYVLVYFAMGRLPWQNLKANGEKHRLDQIKDMKEKNGYDDLTRNLDPIFEKYMQKVFELGYFDDPDYEDLKKIFSETLKKEKVLSDKFDWNTSNQKKKKSIQEIKFNKKTHFEEAKLWKNKSNDYLNQISVNSSSQITEECFTPAHDEENPQKILINNSPKSMQDIIIRNGDSPKSNSQETGGKQRFLGVPSDL